MLCIETSQLDPSCMVHKGDLQIISKVLRNLEAKNGTIEFNAPLVVAALTYNIIDELKAEGDSDVLQKYSGFEYHDSAPKEEARTEYENMMYLERPRCNLCLGNQEYRDAVDGINLIKFAPPLDKNSTIQTALGFIPIRQV